MRREALAALVIASLAAGGCAQMSRKFTFMRPDVSRKSSRQVAPDYEVRSDKRRSSVLLASDRLALANRYLRAGDLTQAEAQAQSVLKLDPKSADAHTVLALAASQRGQADRAGGYYAKAAELAPRSGRALNNYGAWLCANGRAAESLAWFDRAVADPAYATPASALANAGACALDAGQPARAERDLRLALQREPADPTALSAMARHEYDAGRYLQARAFAERRLAAAAPNVEILRLASQIEQKLGDLPAAARYMQQLTALPQAGRATGDGGRQ
jgi:type IV pilus assembly protein PilF